MTLSASRLTEVTPSQCRWEQVALNWLRDNLPDEDGWHVWTNGEFFASSGAVYEIDAMKPPAAQGLAEATQRFEEPLDVELRRPSDLDPNRGVRHAVYQPRRPPGRYHVSMCSDADRCHEPKHLGSSGARRAP